MRGLRVAVHWHLNVCAERVTLRETQVVVLRVIPGSIRQQLELASAWNAPEDLFPNHLVRQVAIYAPKASMG